MAINSATGILTSAATRSRILSANTPLIEDDLSFETFRSPGVIHLYECLAAYPSTIPRFVQLLAATPQRILNPFHSGR